MRNHGKIDPNRLSQASKIAIMNLAMALRAEGHGLYKAQITFDDLHGDQAGFDDPPTIHVITQPHPQAVAHWLGEQE